LLRGAHPPAAQGLLHNWGCCLHSLAEHAPFPVLSERLAVLEEAAARLRTSAEFGPMDAAPLNALGAWSRRDADATP
jgi:hypothetical protein